MSIRLPRTVCVSVAFALLSWPDTAKPDDYDPLTTSPGKQNRTVELTVLDEARNREIPILVYLTAKPSTSPMVLFSHGLGGSRRGCSYLGEHWSSRGFLCVFLQHPGSDSTVWQNVPLGKRMQALQKAGNNQNFTLRVEDVKAVLDQLEIWNRKEGHPLAGRMNLNRIGMSGHSFGARTTQAISGQIFPGTASKLADERIAAALPLSPSSPAQGKPGIAFGKISIPWMLMTGTRDAAPFGNSVDPQSRLKVFTSLPPGDKYQLVLHEAEHSAFTDQTRQRQAKPRNPNHHGAIQGLSTAFWDAHLRNDRAAQAWLQGEGPRSLLEKRDRWQVK